MHFINKYRKGMPLPKKMLEDTMYRIYWLINYFKNGKQIKTALFYPQFPSKSTVLHKAFRYLNFNITNNPEKIHSVAIFWYDWTFSEPDGKVLELAKTKKVVNLHCNDISKSYVDEVFNKIFGYSSLVDCTNYTGLMVKKNEINAVHDGEIVQGPVAREQGFVYQKLINNVVGGKFVADMRVPVIGGKIPLVFVKYKTLETRFGLFKRFHHRLKNAEVHPPDKLFSADEIEKIILFCNEFGLDYGEVDVLRDLDDGRIYLIDVNNTPTGPPYLDKKAKKEALQAMASAFAEAFI
ncbi:MAG: hypothetical protein IH598_09435 [Bacteroidales bacterium]|nr:hypothetical protein [Bacteroidales bacterium]